MTAAKKLAPLMSSDRMDWNTPAVVLDLVRRVGPIGLDPCSNLTSIVGARVEVRREVDNLDGLALDWGAIVRPGEVVFCNPPYGREIGDWVAKCEIGSQRRGVQTIALVPARPDTRWWHDWCAPPASQAVCFWRGRLRFEGAPSCAPFPSALVYWGPRPGLFEDVFREAGSIWRAA